MDRVSVSTAVSTREAHEALDALPELPVAQRAAIRVQALDHMKQIVDAMAAHAKSGKLGCVGAAGFVKECAGVVNGRSIPFDLAKEKLAQQNELTFAALEMALGVEQAGAVWASLSKQIQHLWSDV